MKKNIFFVFIIEILFGINLLVPKYSYCQNYTPFPNSTALWKIVYSDPTILPCGIHYSYYYFMLGDTNILNFTYKKIYFCYETYYCSASNTPFVFWGGIRQDTINKKVYCYNSTDGDSLLYDFNLNLNDTVKRTYINPDTIPQTVFYIDSAQLLDGSYHKRYWCNAFVILEGVGSNFGLFESYKEVNFGETHHLSCFKVDSLLLLSGNSSCSYPVLIDNSANLDILSIRPNPTLDKVFINSKTPIKEVSVLTSTNKVILTIHKGISSYLNEAVVSLSTFPIGVYFVKITLINDIVLFKGILKTN